MKRNTRPAGPVFTRSVQHFMVAPAMYDDVVAYQKLHGLKSVAAAYRACIQAGLDADDRPANKTSINDLRFD